MAAIISYTALSFLLVGLYRWLALRYRWLDHPNHRSSHTTITPRGAGIVFSVLIVGATAHISHHRNDLFFVFLPSLVVALTGWWDDLRGASARTRFALYLSSAAITVALVFATPAHLILSELPTTSLWILGAIVTLSLVWLINLYNFMDGINGIAATEALFVLLAIHLLAHDTLYSHLFSLIHLFGCAAIAGFLLWNFPAGKVFMGDAGSAFLGLFLGVLILLSFFLEGPVPAVWLILLGVFIVDSGYTLMVRIVTRQMWHSAHRLHAYQRLTDRLHGNHACTVGLILVVNVGWLLPLAWLVHTNQISALGGIGLAYTPLAGACFWLRAGILEQGQV